MREQPYPECLLQSERKLHALHPTAVDALAREAVNAVVVRGLAEYAITVSYFDMGVFAMFLRQLVHLSHP